MTFKQLLPATAMTMLLSGAIYAGEKVDRTIGVSSDGVVQIENVRGIIRVEGWDRGEVSVKGTLDDSAERLIFETNGAVTNVIVKMPKGNIKRGDGSNLVIRVPNTNQVDFEGVSSDLFVKNISGGVDLVTVSGDIDTNNISKQVFLKSVSGDLVIKESSGQARLSSVSGDIEAKLDMILDRLSMMEDKRLDEKEELEERRARGRDREGMQPDARRRPMEEQKLREAVRKALKASIKKA